MSALKLPDLPAGYMVKKNTLRNMERVWYLGAVAFLVGNTRGLRRRPGRPPVADSRDAQNVSSSVVVEGGGQNLMPSVDNVVHVALHIAHGDVRVTAILLLVKSGACLRHGHT